MSDAKIRAGAVSTDDFERVLEEVDKYETSNFGARYGEDYPEFATAIAPSQRAALTALVNMLAIGLAGPPKIDNPDDVDLVATLRNHPAMHRMLHLLYVGYRLGRMAAEREYQALDAIIKETNKPQ